MTESKRTRVALADVQRAWPTAVIRKFNDRATKGIPDAEILYRARVAQIEFKDADCETVEQLMATPRGKLQLYELQRAARAGAVALVVVFRNKQTEIYEVATLQRVSTKSLIEYLEGREEFYTR